MDALHAVRPYSAATLGIIPKGSLSILIVCCARAGESKPQYHHFPHTLSIAFAPDKKGVKRYSIRRESFVLFIVFTDYLLYMHGIAISVESIGEVT